MSNRFAMLAALCVVLPVGTAPFALAVDVHAVIAVVGDRAAFDPVIATRLGRLDAAPRVPDRRNILEEHPTAGRTGRDLDPVRSAGNGDPGNADIAGRYRNDAAEAASDDLRCPPVIALQMQGLADDDGLMVGARPEKDRDPPVRGGDSRPNRGESVGDP